MRLTAFVALAVMTSLLPFALSPILAPTTAGPAISIPTVQPPARLAIQPMVPPGGAWTLRGSQLPGRDAPSWVYDSRADRFILFGGSVTSSTVTNSTWSYDYANNTWTNITPIAGPSPRAIASMVYDAHADRAILFGGSPAFPVSLSDTWIFDYKNRTWTNVTKTTHPPSRVFAAMAYDPVDDKSLLFGGAGGPYGNVMYADTWAYDYSTDTWSLRSPAGSPSGRFGATMAYDPVAQATLEFGGLTISGTSLAFSNDVYSYAYTANAWTHLLPPVSPPGRAAGAMAYDATAQRFILFGGTGGLLVSSYRNDTWAYSSASNRWANLTPVHSPMPRSDAVMDFDVKAGRSVLFGGASTSSTPLDDAWSYEYGAALPTAPLNLVAVGGTLQVTLTWQAPASDGGSSIVNYSIYRGTISGGETVLKTVGPVLTYTDPAVKAGTTYYYEVSAVNGAGEGAKSNEAYGTPPAAPSAPQTLTATAGNGRVVLTWAAPASNGGAAITAYKVYRGTTSGSETLLATLGSVLTYTDSGVTNGGTYYYEVSAVNGVGESPVSNEIHATPTAPADTTPPSITITSLVNNSLLTSTAVTVTGTASDDVAVQKVELSTDGTHWTRASGTTSWSGSVALTAGPNTIYARATDTSGNPATMQITVTVQLQGPAVLGPQSPLTEGLIALTIVVAVAAAGAVVLLARRRRRSAQAPTTPPSTPPPRPPPLAPPPGNP
ncbi:MAG TPA: kelch repeat-containing protein [Thermoplasmata archaeon]|nr:kelch repeat-containing protein [Thermoplasmata archaeon]